MAHPERIDDARNTKKTSQDNLYQKRPTRRPKVRWKDDVWNDVKKWELLIAEKKDGGQ